MEELLDFKLTEAFFNFAASSNIESRDSVFPFINAKIISLSSEVSWGAFSPGFIIAKFIPFSFAASIKRECIAALNELFPLKAKDKLLSPPLIPQYERFSFSH